MSEKREIPTWDFRANPKFDLQQKEISRLYTARCTNNEKLLRDCFNFTTYIFKLCLHPPQPLH